MRLHSFLLEASATRFLSLMLAHSLLLLTIYFHGSLMRVWTRYWESCLFLTSLYWLVVIPLRQVQLTLPIYLASCGIVNVMRVFLHSALFPVSLNTSRLQRWHQIRYLLLLTVSVDRRWSESLSSEAGIGSGWRRIKSTVDLTVNETVMKWIILGKEWEITEFQWL